MTIIDRSALTTPSVPREAVFLAPLGGDVIVRGLMLSEMIELASLKARIAAPVGTETEAEALARASGAMVAEQLHRCVVLADFKPVYTAAEWDSFGAMHPADVLALYSVVRRLNGEDAGANEKN